MSDDSKNPVEALKDDLRLNLTEFADKLGCSKGHAHDLITRRRPVTATIAHKLEAISGKPWHEWMDAPSTDESEKATAA